MKRWVQNPVRLVESELSGDLGSGKVIFIGSSTDMFASNIPDDWIIRTLDYCSNYPDNEYLFQSKNPYRFLAFTDYFPINTTLTTTIETNREYNISSAPSIRNRISGMRCISRSMFRTQVTIEPIMDFDLEILVSMMSEINPDVIVIGADSQDHRLPEPSSNKVAMLVEKLGGVVSEVILKTNLKRLLNNA